MADGSAVRRRLADVHHDLVEAERVGQVAAEGLVVRRPTQHLDHASQHSHAGTAVGEEAARLGMLPACDTCSVTNRSSASSPLLVGAQMSPSKPPVCVSNCLTVISELARWSAVRNPDR